MKTRPRRYQGDRITVGFEGRRCIHAAECVRGLPLVFDPQRRPWIKLDEAERDAIVDVVERCPTGALTYELSEGEGEAIPQSNTVRVRPRGPLIVRGNVELTLADGQTESGTRMALCRCGASSNKPFCDNSHRPMGFDDVGRLADSRLAGEGDEGEGGRLELRVATGGPLLIRGPVEVTGSASETQCGEKGALCRCGASSAKPYCDGSHKGIDFEAD